MLLLFQASVLQLLQDWSFNLVWISDGLFAGCIDFMTICHRHDLHTYKRESISLLLLCFHNGHEVTSIHASLPAPAPLPAPASLSAPVIWYNLTSQYGSCSDLVLLSVPYLHQVEEKFQQISLFIEGKPYQRHVVRHFYAVENSLGSAEDDQVGGLAYDTPL